MADQLFLLVKREAIKQSKSKIQSTISAADTSFWCNIKLSFPQFKGLSWNWEDTVLDPLINKNIYAFPVSYWIKSKISTQEKPGQDHNCRVTKCKWDFFFQGFHTSTFTPPQKKNDLQVASNNVSYYKQLALNKHFQSPPKKKYIIYKHR